MAKDEELLILSQEIMRLFGCGHIILGEPGAIAKRIIRETESSVG